MLSWVLEFEGIGTFQREYIKNIIGRHLNSVLQGQKLHLRHRAHLSQLLPSLLYSRLLMENCRTLSAMSTCTICLWNFILPSSTFMTDISQLRLPGQIIDKLVEGEDAEADFIVGCFCAALKQAGEGHSRWGPG